MAGILTSADGAYHGDPLAPTLGGRRPRASGRRHGEPTEAVEIHVDGPGDDPLAAAEGFLEIGRPQLASAQLDRLREAYLEVAYVAWLRIHVALALDHADDALSLARKAVKLHPDHPAVLTAAAEAAWAAERRDQAETWMLAAIDADPDVEWRCRYADLLRSAGQLRKATALLDAIELDDDAPVESRRMLARARLAHALHDDADDRRAAAADALRSIDADDPFLAWVTSLDDADGDDVDDEREGEEGRAAAAVGTGLGAAEGADLLGRQLRRRRYDALLVPLWPIERFGVSRVWIAGYLLAQLIRAMSPTVGGYALGAWIGYCVYSWIATALVSRAQRR